jgi:protease-4
MELGLIDHFGSAELIARDVIGASRMVDYTYRPGLIDRLARQVGTSIGNVLYSNFLQIR